MPLAESIATLSSYLPASKSAAGVLLVKISYCEILLYYASIARQFKVDSAGSGKVSALKQGQQPPARKIGAMTDHAA
jgi:hypothetical protein